MAEDVILSVKNISKSFGDLQVLKKISFDIHKGKRLQSLVPAVLVNPQSSGVSTSWKPTTAAKSIIWKNL
mgnify:FL=1